MTQYFAYAEYISAEKLFLGAEFATTIDSESGYVVEVDFKISEERTQKTKPFHFV